ncbi:MAG: HAMP domain-containing histidine kinase [Bacteroidia bacterium]|jgi:signal transduction histidine kinase|nr:HAMP domain-containing histidine kinase [Bacteroidia bacterium]
MKRTIVSLRLYVIVWLLFNSLNGLSQSTYLFKQFNKKDGLVSNGVSLIIKDNNGFYWLMTDDGLVKWNGNSFKKHSILNLSVSKSHWQVTRLEDKLIFYNQDDIILIDEKSNVKKFDKNQLQNIVLVEKGHSVNLKNYKRAYENAPRKIKDLIDEFRSNSYGFKTGQQVSDSVIAICKNNLILVFSPEKIFGFKDNCDTSVLIKFNNNCYRFSENGTCMLITPSAIKKVDIKTKNTKIPYPNFENDWWININTDSFLYGFTTKGLVRKYSMVGDTIKTDTIIKELPKYIYRYLYVDQTSNSICLSTYTEGFIYFYEPLVNKILNNEYTSQIIYSQTIHSKTNKLLNNQTLMKYIYPKGKDWDWGNISSIKTLRNGNILVFARHKAIFLSPDFKLIKELDLRTVNSSYVHQIIETNDKIFYRSNELGIIDKSTNKITKIEYKKILNGKEISAICKGKDDDEIYIAFHNLLYTYNVKLGKFKKIKTLGNNIYFLLFDDNFKGLWIIDRGLGLGFIDSTNHWYKLPIGLTRQLDEAHYVLKDQTGDYWLSTNKGIFLLQKSQLKRFFLSNDKVLIYLRLGALQGLEEEEMNGGVEGCGITFGDSISIASINGSIRFHINIKSKMTEKINRVFISSIKVNDSLYNTNEKLILENDYNNLEVECDYPNINQSYSLLYYRLLNSADNDWKIANSSTINLSRLPAGDYNLQLATDFNNPKSYFDFNFTVKQVWYARWYYLTLFAILFVIVIYYLNRFIIDHEKGKVAIRLDSQRVKLFSIIAHDLRSPVNMFNGVVDTIEYLIRNERYHDIKRIGGELDKATKGLQLMLNNLLQWSLSQQNLVKTKPEVINIVLLVEQLVQLYNHIASYKNIELKVETDNQYELNTDKLIFELVIRNLLDNAIKYSAMSTQINIKITSVKEGLKIQIINSPANPLEDTKYIQIQQLFNNDAVSHQVEQQSGLGLLMIKESLTKLNAKLKFDYIKKSNLLFVNVLFA